MGYGYKITDFLWVSFQNLKDPRKILTISKSIKIETLSTEFHKSSTNQQWCLRMIFEVFCSQLLSFSLTSTYYYKKISKVFSTILPKNWRSLREEKFLSKSVNVLLILAQTHLELCKKSSKGFVWSLEEKYDLILIKLVKCTILEELVIENALAMYNCYRYIKHNSNVAHRCTIVYLRVTTQFWILY